MTMATKLFFSIMMCLSAIFFCIQVQFQIYSLPIHKINLLPYTNDYYHYYESSKRAFTVGGPYCKTFDKTKGDELEKVIRSGTNPPTLIAALYPLTLLGREVSWAIWLVILFITCGATSFALLRFLGNSRSYSFALAMLFCLSGPLLSSYRFAQVSPILFALVGLSFIFSVQERQRASGLMLGTAIALKFFLLPITLFLWAAHRKKAAKYSLISFASFSVLTEIFTSASILDWIKCATPIINAYSKSTTFNQSLYGIILNISRALSLDQSSYYLFIRSQASLIEAIFIILTFAMAYYFGHFAKAHKSLFSWSYSTTIFGTIVLIPLAWSHYFCITLISIFVYLQEVKCQQLRSILIFLLFTTLPFVPFVFGFDQLQSMDALNKFEAWSVTFIPAILLFTTFIFLARYTYLKHAKNFSKVEKL